MIFYVFRKRTPELSQTQIKISSPGQNSIFDIDFPLTLLFNPQLRQGFNPVTGYKALQFLKGNVPTPVENPIHSKRYVSAQSEITFKKRNAYNPRSDLIRSKWCDQETTIFQLPSHIVTDLFVFN